MAIKTRQTTATGVTNNNAPLTNAELDNNFVELQQNKVDASGDTMTGNLSFGDNDKIRLGDDNDLEIVHTGSHSYIQDVGTGNLRLRGTDVRIESNSGYDMLSTVDEEGVTVYYANAAKLATSSTGVDITGEVKADKFTNDEALPDVRPNIMLDFKNSKQLDPRISFSRGSTATYYDGETKVKAEENLHPRSQEFDHSTWTKAGCSITANDTTAPDGTTTADHLIQSSASAELYDYTPINLGYVTFSVFAKVSTSGSWVRLLVGDGGQNLRGFYNVSTGATGISTANGGSEDVSISVEDYGNGWYRLILSGQINANANPYVSIIMADDDGSDTRDDDGRVYLWGAQVEERGFATEYLATSGLPIIKYQPKMFTAAVDEPRFDHDPATGLSKGLLVEEERANLHSYSEDASLAAGLNQMAVRSNVAVAPDGTKTADLVYPITATGRHEIQPRWSATSGEVYAFSVYLKAFGAVTQASFSHTGGYQVSALFDLINGTVTNRGAQSGTHAAIEDVGNGWYRCILIGAATSTNTSYSMYISPADENGTLATQADTVFTNQAANFGTGILLWGVQAEIGDFSTSYIPTNGSNVSREADTPRMRDIGDLIPRDNGTLFAEFSIYRAAGGRWSPIAQLNDAATTRSVVDMRAWQSGYGSLFVFQTYSGASNLLYDNAAITGGETYWFAIRWDEDGNIQAFKNGATVASDTGRYVSSSIDTLDLGYGDTNVRRLDGHLKRVVLYPASLTTPQIQAISEE